MNLKEITDQYSQLTGEKIKQPISLFSPEFKTLQEKILEKGSVFGLKLISPKDFNTEKAIKKEFPKARDFEILEQSWEQTLFFGYKVRFDVEALTVVLEEYLPVALRSNGNRWEILEGKIFDLYNENLERVKISKDEITDLEERSRKLIRFRLENPAGTIENILTKIDAQVEDFRKKKFSDISKYDKQKREEVQKEIDDVEEQIKEKQDELKRAKELGRISFKRIAELQEEIKDLENEKYKLEAGKVVRLQKLDEERQEALLRVDGKCELRINAELYQIGVIEYESLKTKVKTTNKEIIVEIIPATGEVLSPEVIEKEKIIEPEFKILPEGTRVVSPVPPSLPSLSLLEKIKFKKEIDWRSLIFWVLIVIFILILFWQPSLAIKVIGGIGLFTTFYFLSKHLIDKINTELRTVETAQKTISKIDKISWREFEKFVAELFKGMGYEVKLLGGWGGDYGADLIATDPKTGIRYAVQAKKWTRFRVGTSAIKEVLLAWSVYDCDAGIVVTNNYFTERAGILPCKIKKLRVDLWDRDVLIEKIKETSK